MQYMWSTTILLHRPFIDYWQHNKSSDLPLDSHEDPFEVCISAANSICSVLEQYCKILEGLPCDLVFPIFSAANIFLRQYKQLDSQRILSRQRLELCIEWLSVLGKSWKSAFARRDILVECEDKVELFIIVY
jgi:hypothetical protein